MYEEGKIPDSLLLDSDFAVDKHQFSGQFPGAALSWSCP